MKVEQQLKARKIPYTHIMPSSTTTNSVSSTLPRAVSDSIGWIHSSLASSVPVLCVRSADILLGSPAAEAAMQNIRIVPINWWSERKCQVSFLYPPEMGFVNIIPFRLLHASN